MEPVTERRTLSAAVVGTCLVALCAFFATLTTTAGATTTASHDGTTTYQVTVAARLCANYSDVFANRNRNNIMESLKDLGPDSPYQSFTQVKPSVEDGLAPQSSCAPLTGWNFAFGNGYTRPAPGTNLSYVTGTSSTNNRVETTKASTPLLDGNGNPTGSTIAGATTYTLSAQEASLASAGNRYWVQGGTPSQPLGPNPADYGFAALRCATDNLNGDNVEWVSFPSGVTHVFCYAFYVQPPPGAGVIKIVKTINAPQPTAESFDFNGSLSYNTSGHFKITIPAGQTSGEADFVRGETLSGEAPWSVTETIPSNYQLATLSCASPGASTWALTGSNPDSLVPGNADGLAITLTAADTVTCTFANQLKPPPVGDITLTKQVLGPTTGTLPQDALPASFDYTLTGPGSSLASTTLTVPAGTDSSPTTTLTSLASGSWTITETPPAPTPGWYWSPVGAECALTGGSSATSNTGSITFTLPVAGGAACSFTNQLVATGSLAVHFTTNGGTGTFSADIASPDGTLLHQTATTTTQGVATLAVGDSTSPLSGNWNVVPIAPAPTTAGHFEISGLPTCNVGAPHAENIGHEQLSVNPSNPVVPDVECDFVYNFIPASTLTVTKAVTGDQAGRTQPVVIAISCADGAAATLTLPANEPGPTALATPLNLPMPTTCSIQETENGASSTATVTTTNVVTVNGSVESRPLDAVTVGTQHTAENVVITVTNNYALPVPPTPNPPAPNDGSGANGINKGAQPLAMTGFPFATLLVSGLALLLVGTALLYARRRRN